MIKMKVSVLSKMAACPPSLSATFILNAIVAKITAGNRRINVFRYQLNQYTHDFMPTIFMASFRPVSFSITIDRVVRMTVNMKLIMRMNGKKPCIIAVKLSSFHDGNGNLLREMSFDKASLSVLVEMPMNVVSTAF